MASGFGRIVAGAADVGAGFALSPRLVITANHVIRKHKGSESLRYIPAGGDAVEVQGIQESEDLDAAALSLAADVAGWLPVVKPVRGARWRVDSPPPGTNDPPLTGLITTARMVFSNAKRHQVEAAQLEVKQLLGNYGGYSGSAVLDASGRAVVGLLVEQKHLRLSVQPGEQKVASNVLFAIPVDNVVAAFKLNVSPGRPSRFTVGLAPAGMVARGQLTDEAIELLARSPASGDRAQTIMLRGPGGTGKTVLARQIADDPRAWSACPGGLVMITAGENASADFVADQVRANLGVPRDWPLADALAGDRLLLIVDDVWSPDLLATLVANLPPNVTVLTTTRGITFPGAATVNVGASTREEAIQILARRTTRSSEVDSALSALAQALFRWPLLLSLAAAELHDDDFSGPGLDALAGQFAPTDAALLITKAYKIRDEFPGYPTMLDDLERVGEGQPPRSVDVLVRRSLKRLENEDQERFGLTAIYPPDVPLTRAMLQDLWSLEERASQKRMRVLVRVGLAQWSRSDETAIEIHDLIVAWLHHRYGAPDSTDHHPVHQRLAGLCFDAWAAPRDLTADRVSWLAFHLVAARSWNLLQHFRTLRWRNAFLEATGDDAAFLSGLDLYARAAVRNITGPNDACYHAVGALLFASHVRDLIGQLPQQALIAMAALSNPKAALTQAAYNSDPGVFASIISASGGRPDIIALIEYAVTVIKAIPDAIGAERGRPREEALAKMGPRVAAIDPGNADLVEQAVSLAAAISDDKERCRALAGIAQNVAAADPARACELLEQAAAVARGIVVSWDDLAASQALADIAEQYAAVDVSDAGVVEGAVGLARTIPDPGKSSQALAGIAALITAVGLNDADTLNRAITLTDGIPRPRERSVGLATIARQVADRDRAVAEHLLERATASADGISDAEEAGLALAGIAEQVAAFNRSQARELAERAAALAATIPEKKDRSRALTQIAINIVSIDPAEPQIVERAVKLADTMTAGSTWSRGKGNILGDPQRMEWGRGPALSGIAEKVIAVDPGNAEMVDRAVELVGSIEMGRGEALAKIAAQIAAASPNADLVERAFQLVNAIPYEWERGPALVELFAVHPGNAEMMDRAARIAGAISDEEQRGQALAGIVSRFAVVNAGNVPMLDRAVQLAGTISIERIRGQALAGIAAQVAAADPARAQQLLDHAVALATRARGGDKRGETLAKVAIEVAAVDPGNAEMVDRAVRLAGAIFDEKKRGQAVAGVAGKVAAVDLVRARQLLDQAIAVAGTAPRYWIAREDITRMAAAIDPHNAEMVAQAISLAGAIQEEGDRYWGNRSWALAQIAGQVAAADPALARQLLEQAATLATSIPEAHGERGEALAWTARQMAAIDPGDAEMVTRAISLADAIQEDGNRSWALAQIAGQVAAADPALARQLLEQAATLATSIPDDKERSLVTTRIAKQIAIIDPTDTATVEWAINLANTIPTINFFYSGPSSLWLPRTGVRWGRAEALAGISEAVAAAEPGGADVITRAAAIAVTIAAEDDRSMVLHEINRGSVSYTDELEQVDWRIGNATGCLDMISMFLRNSPAGSPAATGFARAVCDVEMEFE